MHDPVVCIHLNPPFLPIALGRVIYQAVFFEVINVTHFDQRQINASAPARLLLTFLNFDDLFGIEKS